MSRFLLINFEEFTLNQDITTTIQPYSPFCLCCLDRDCPMINLDKCIHSNYLDAFGKSETYTNHTFNNKRINNLTKENTTEVLHLPPEENTIENNINLNINDVNSNIAMDPNSNIDVESNSKIDIEPNSNIAMEPYSNNDMEPKSNMDMELNSNIDIEPNSNIDIESNSNISMEPCSNNNMEPISNIDIETSSNIAMEPCSNINMESLSNIDMEQNSNIEMEQNSNIAMGPYSNNDMEPNSNIDMEPNSNIDMDPNSNIDMEAMNSSLENDFVNIQISLEDNLDSNRLTELNKNIKTALDIIERNNQSFVTLGGQLQFLNGEHLSFLETSLLSKEILTDIPLVPAKMSTDLENGLSDNSKLGIEIDGPEIIFFDGLDLSPHLLNTEMEAGVEPLIQTSVPEPTTVKPKMKPKAVKNKPPQQIRPVRISLDELNKERLRKAQSDCYLKFKFRCGTCLLGFNYEENLDDHKKRKHGTKLEDNVICDICSQLIQSAGAMTEHNYRHYTRYDCVQCGKRFYTRDEATRHYMQSHPKVKKRKLVLKKGKLKK